MARQRGMVGTLKRQGRGATTDFGAFYAHGYVIAAIPDGGDARRVRKDLLTGGYEERDVLYFEPDAASSSLRRNLEESGRLADIGMTKQTMRRQLALAEKGCHFLLAHAPSREETERVMNVLHRVPFRLAQKYHRFAIEDLE